MAPPADFIGSRRFSIVRLLGRGGMGVVYEAYDHERELRVALKTIRDLNPSSLYRFKREFRGLTELVHPNLVTLHEFISDGSQWFFTMELIDDGINFLSYVRPEANCGSSSPAGAPVDHSASTFDAQPTEIGENPSATSSNVESAARCDREEPHQRRPLAGIDFDRLRGAFAQLVEGVCAIHAAGKLHRDLKPSNVMVRADGRVVLLDFGLVAELHLLPTAPVGGGPRGEADDSTEQTLESSIPEIVGTVRYMAPEQAAGKPLTEACDWYAVGTMLYEALTGRPPFQGPARSVLLAKQRSDPPSPAELFHGVPHDLNALCMELLDRDPARRPGGREILVRLAGQTAAAAKPADAVFGSPGLPFVGRETQLAVLFDAYRELCEGRAVECHVRGRSGAGKSRLIQHFIERLSAQHDVVALTGRCYERESVPYKALDNLVDALTRYLLRLPPGERPALRGDTRALARVFPVLERVLPERSRDAESSAVPDLRELQRRAFRALKELLAAIGERTPLVLHIDDLQWGDTDSAVLLRELLVPPHAPRLLLLLSYRSEHLQTSDCLRALIGEVAAGASLAVRRELQVDALSAEEARELARRLLAESPDAAAVAERVARESRGSPLFVHELVQNARGGQGRLVFGRLQDGLSLDEVLWHRIAGLPDDDRRLLEIVSVSGQPLRLRQAYDAAGQAQRDPRRVARLRSDHLVRTTGPGLDDDLETFHDRIRETVVAHLPRETLRSHHGCLATLLEAAGDADPETIAVHFDEAGEPAKAGQFYAVAASRAAQALAFQRAAKLYTRSMEVLPPVGSRRRELRTQLADALANAGRGAEAADQYLAAAEEATGTEQIELERKAGYQLCVSGRVDRGREVLRDNLSRVGMRLPNGSLGSLLALLPNRARLRLRGTQFREREAEQVPADVLARIEVSWSASAGLSMFDVIGGADFQARNLLLALRAGEPYRIARALAYEAVHVSNAGRVAASRTQRLIRQAEEIVRRIGHPHAEGMVVLAQGVAEFQLGNWRPAHAILDRAEQIFRDRCTGVAWELGSARSFSLWAQFYMGQFAASRDRAVVVLNDAQERGDLYAASNLGLLFEPLRMLMRDDPGEADRVLGEYMGRCSHRGFHIQDLLYLLSHSFICLYRGDGRAGLAELLNRWPSLRRSLLLSGQMIRIVMLQLRARCLLAAAQTSRSPAPYLREAEAIGRKLVGEGVGWATAFAELLQAGISARRGDADGAVVLLKECAGRFDKADMALYACVCRRRLGQLLGGGEGERLIADADAWLRGEQIDAPARMAAIHSPGFSD